MAQVTIIALRVVIALALIGSVVVQIMIVPAIWVDLVGAPPVIRICVISIIVLGVLAMQVFALCVWMLLTRIRRGSVFSESSLRYVDIIVGAICTTAVLAFAMGVLLALGEAAPGVVGLVCGAGLVLAGMALLVVVMKMLLRQAIAREREATALRAELDEVV